MIQYQAPIDDAKFLIEDVVGLERTALIRQRDDMTPELVDMLLQEAGKFSSEILAPLNHTGDREGCRWENGDVFTPNGFKAAYQNYVEAGWNGIRCEEEFGGQNLPHVLAIAIEEMITSANLSFALSPALNMGAIEALSFGASEELKQTYLAKMVSGEWAGTMNLTEPQAGSDLANIRTKAVPQDDHYLISGQKIFITYGEHDFTDNIIHLVLARTPTAPAGVKGISLFVVPKFLVNADGSLGSRNDVQCVSIEHKLGIHGSPTCVMSYGDTGGAIGYLVGEENRGLEYMFVMMNLSRLNSGMQGPALGERAYQQAVDYAKNRVQGGRNAAGEKLPIIEYPDVKRMLLSMKAQNEAMRALVYAAAEMLDGSLSHNADPSLSALPELLTPIVKGWCTEVGQEVTYLGIQVHGGMGFIEETGIAQHYRDARIITIYEGTTAIQANDLLMRKIYRDKGETFRQLLALMQKTEDQLAQIPQLQSIYRPYAQGVERLEQALTEMLSLELNEKLAVAVPFLMFAGYTAGAWMMARSAIVAHEKLKNSPANSVFYETKIQTAEFYMHGILSKGIYFSALLQSGAACIASFESQAL